MLLSVVLPNRAEWQSTRQMEKETERKRRGERKCGWQQDREMHRDINSEREGRRHNAWVGVQFDPARWASNFR